MLLHITELISPVYPLVAVAVAILIFWVSELPYTELLEIIEYA